MKSEKKQKKMKERRQTRKINFLMKCDDNSENPTDPANE